MYSILENMAAWNYSPVSEQDHDRKNGTFILEQIELVS